MNPAQGRLPYKYYHVRIKCCMDRRDELYWPPPYQYLSSINLKTNCSIGLEQKVDKFIAVRKNLHFKQNG